MKEILVISGPNLNLLGKREVEIYGNISFSDYLAILKKQFSSFTLDYFQSNVEGELINKLHEVGFSYDYILLNAGGYTHTSVSLSDAILKSKGKPLATRCHKPALSYFFPFT